MTFEGVHWSALEPLVQPKPSARYVVAHAEEGYTANVPIAFLRDPLSLLATHADGEPLTPEHGGPLRLVIPRKYFWKSAKWLRGLELTAKDRPGFWERYGYHNDADPFKEERYGFYRGGSADPREPLLHRAEGRLGSPGRANRRFGPARPQEGPRGKRSISPRDMIPPEGGRSGCPLRRKPGYPILPSSSPSEWPSQRPLVFQG